MNKEVLFAHYPKATVKRYQDLLGAFSNLDNAWKAEFNDFKHIGWKTETINDFIYWRKNINLDKIAEKLDSEQIHCITKNDSDYPPLLREIFDPPFCLFVRGSLKNINYPLAIVGPRKYSIYGKQIAQSFASKLAHIGFTIISGLALGIDGIAHSSALDVNGMTSAVLGSGVNKSNVYPHAHKHLSERIINAGGALISEYPPGTEANKFTFPQRNRIVAGMSLGTLVIEGALKSGALITAQCALDDGRELFAVPQNITSPTSSGVNTILKTGAHLVTNETDILEILNLSGILESIKPQTNVTPASSTEEKILSVISEEPIHIDFIVKSTNLPSNSINSTLALLELSGKIRNLGSMMFVKVS
ncbi:MAG: DNA-processing protein DprA [bacterium]|nr:DNA-processing protein DprA [bacterium]